MKESYKVAKCFVAQVARLWTAGFVYILPRKISKGVDSGWHLQSTYCADPVKLPIPFLLNLLY